VNRPQVIDVLQRSAIIRQTAAGSLRRGELVWIQGGKKMPEGKAVFLGLNQTGLIVFIILIIVCLPLCWIPFLIDSMKGEPE
jgi:hypothetical protein